MAEPVDATDLDRRDPAQLRRWLPWLERAFDRYFRVELDGAEHLPTGPAIYFGNHSGSTYTVEGALLATAIFRRHGVEHPLYFLAHRAFFGLPGLGRWLPTVGAVLADRDVARRILARGGQFVVFPGGDRDSHKPFRDRHRVDFHGHAGFIRTAIATRTPLVPFAHVGTHETLLVLSRGDRVARALGLDRRFGLHVFPVVVSAPFGLSVGPLYPAVPLPAKIAMRVCPPVRLWELGWSDPDDAVQVAAALAHLTHGVQDQVDALAAARRRPFFG